MFQIGNIKQLTYVNAILWLIWFIIQIIKTKKDSKYYKNKVTFISIPSGAYLVPTIFFAIIPNEFLDGIGYYYFILLMIVSCLIAILDDLAPNSIKLIMLQKTEQIRNLLGEFAWKVFLFVLAVVPVFALVILFNAFLYSINNPVPSGPGYNSNNSSNNSPGIHHVDPHYVNGYFRNDGTFVDGYFRGGDNGYDRSNPDGDPNNNLN